MPKSSAPQTTDTMHRIGNTFLRIALALGMTSAGNGAITFSFDYSAAPDFNPTSTAALESAASTVGSWFANTATISMQVTSSNVNESRLASAGSNYAGTPTTGFGNMGVVQKKVLTGTDLNGAGFDGSVDVNFFHNWGFGDSVAGNQYDFRSTAMHELLHALGFASSILQNGNDTYGTTPGNPGYWEPFDQFVSYSGSPIIDPFTFSLNPAAWNSARTGGSGAGGLSFTGSNAMASNGGQPVYLYSPTAWEDGSSGSHLDDEYYTSENLMMEAATTTGLGSRTLSPLEQGILSDLGYTVIPEPSSVILAMLGMCSIFSRRRK